MSGFLRTDDENMSCELSELLFSLFEPYAPLEVQIISGKGQAYVKVRLIYYACYSMNVLADVISTGIAARNCWGG